MDDYKQNDIGKKEVDKYELYIVNFFLYDFGIFRDKECWEKLIDGIIGKGRQADV